MCVWVLVDYADTVTANGPWLRQRHVCLVNYYDGRIFQPVNYYEYVVYMQTCNFRTVFK